MSVVFVRDMSGETLVQFTTLDEHLAAFAGDVPDASDLTVKSFLELNRTKLGGLQCAPVSLISLVVSETGPCNGDILDPDASFAAELEKHRDAQGEVHLHRMIRTPPQIKILSLDDAADHRQDTHADGSRYTYDLSEDEFGREVLVVRHQDALVTFANSLTGGAEQPELPVLVSPKLLARDLDFDEFLYAITMYLSNRGPSAVEDMEWKMGSSGPRSIRTNLLGFIVQQTQKSMRPKCLQGLLSAIRTAGLAKDFVTHPSTNDVRYPVNEATGWTLLGVLSSTGVIPRLRSHHQALSQFFSEHGVEIPPYQYPLF